MTALLVLVLLIGLYYILGVHMAEKNQTTKEGHQKKTGFAGKIRWIDKKVLKRSTIDVVVTQNEKGTSEDSTVSSEQHTDLSTSPTWRPWNTPVDQSPNQLKPLAAEGSVYNRLGENERQQMKQIKSQHMETSNERHATEHVCYICIHSICQQFVISHTCKGGCIFESLSAMHSHLVVSALPF